MKNGVILVTLLALHVTHETPAGACSGIRTETRLPADGDVGVPVNTRIFVGGFGPGGFGPFEKPAWLPTLGGPDGLVAVDVEEGGDGRSWWAVLTPKAHLTANTTYTIEIPFGVASTFTTGVEADTTAPAPLLSFDLTPNTPDRCEAISTCGWSSSLDIDRDSRGDTAGLIRVHAHRAGDDAPVLVGVVPETATAWGVGTATQSNNARVFPLTLGVPANGPTPEDWFGQEWCVRLVSEDLAGNATALEDAPESCAVLMDGRPIDCSEEAAGDSDVAPVTTATSNGCTAAPGASPYAVCLILLGVMAASLAARRSRARR